MDRVAGDGSNAQVLSDALGRHDEVRVAARLVLDSIRAVERDGERSVAALRCAMVELGAVVERVNAQEHLSLEPALRKRDAWGAERVEDLRAQHDEAAARVPLSTTTADELLREARSLVRAVVRALRMEECTVLAADLWTDDIINLDPD